MPSEVRSLLFGSEIASTYVQPHIGGDIAFLKGVAKALFKMDEDRPGKIAGVFYYLLVGVVVLELSIEGEAGRWLVARAGDMVFFYTLFVLLRKRSP